MVESGELEVVVVELEVVVVELEVVVVELEVVLVELEVVVVEVLAPLERRQQRAGDHQSDQHAHNAPSVRVR